MYKILIDRIFFQYWNNYTGQYFIIRIIKNVYIGLHIFFYICKVLVKNLKILKWWKVKKNNCKIFLSPVLKSTRYGFYFYRTTDEQKIYKDFLFLPLWSLYKLHTSCHLIYLLCKDHPPIHPEGVEIVGRIEECSLQIKNEKNNFWNWWQLVFVKIFYIFI